MNVSRRRFTQLLGAGAAAAVARPALSLAKPAPEIATDHASVIRLSSNENPYGPSLHALKAMTDSFGLSSRYPDKHATALVESLAKLNDVTSNQILLGDGSSEILKLCAEVFTGPPDNTLAARGKLVTADPTFEAILNYSAANGAEVVKVPLTSEYRHNLAEMMTAGGAGLIYICNPNNPTASITPSNELREFIAKTPAQTMMLVDEAYFHYADSPHYESVIPLIKDHPNLIVARTFSKIYGMAGLRCGYCLAQPPVIDRLRKHQPWDSINCMALAAAVASLDDPTQLSNGQRLVNEAKKFVVEELGKDGYAIIPSQANFIMVDVKQPVVPLIEAMKQHRVEVGRLFPALPNYMRVTIGKKSEMEAFLSAFHEVIS